MTRTGRSNSRPRRACCVLGAIIGATMTAGHMQGQVTRRVPDQPSCARCSIEVRELRKLGDRGGSGVIWGPPANVLQDGIGRYWVFDSKELPAVFDSVGRFVTKVGRKGPGPRDLGDHRGAIAVPGDSMLLFDDRLRAVLVAPDLSIARVMAGRHLLRPSLITRWPDSVVLNGSIPSPESAGYPLHLAAFNAHGVQIVRSFGSQGEQLPKFSLPFESFQVVAPASNGWLWASSILEYGLRRVGPSGEDGLLLRRSSSWFAERSRPWLGNKEHPPPPRMFGVREDSLGLLWVFIQVAAPGWREAWTRVPKGMNDVPVALVSFEKFFDILVEVIDPIAGNVLARRRLSGHAVGLPNGNAHLALYRTNDDGDPSVSIVALTLAGRR